MATANNFSWGPASTDKSHLNGFIVIERALAEGRDSVLPDEDAGDKTVGCRIGESVQTIYRAAIDLARTLQTPEVTAAHLILAILANAEARCELRRMGVRNDHARTACLAQIGALGAAGSGAGGLQPVAEDAMRTLLRRAMDRARNRHDPELHIVGVGDLCAALMDISRDELRIRMLLQGSRPLSATEVAIREAERTILQRLAALGQPTADKSKTGRSLTSMPAGIALIAGAALVSGYAIGLGGGWSTALRWLGQVLV